MSQSFINLELAGFVDANGGLGRQVPSGQVIVPGQISLDGDKIRWRMGRGTRLREVSRSMLNQFVRLTDAESILKFAKNYGVMALANGSVSWPGRTELREGVEPIAAWQYYSRRAQAVLQIGAALRQNKLGDFSDWSKVGILVPASGYTRSHEKSVKTAMLRPHFGMPYTLFSMGESPEQNIKLARKFIAAEVGNWLDCWKQDRRTAVSDFALHWNDVQERWGLEIDYHGLLFAAVALQLALVIAGADSLFVCSGCSIPYIRPRERKRPKSGSANYCDQCSKEGVAKRRAVETYREKRTRAVRMRCSGVSVQEIAEQLNTKAARIRGWLKNVAVPDHG